MEALSVSFAIDFRAVSYNFHTSNQIMSPEYGAAFHASHTNINCNTLPQTCDDDITPVSDFATLRGWFEIQTCEIKTDSCIT